MPFFCLKDYGKSKTKLTEPKEYKIIKDAYFEKDLVNENIDPIEKLERMESRQRNIKNNSR